jgi:CPA1 family monovalent cation:H+ antiporter
VDFLEGESLVNDATGLLALQFGTTILVYGQTPTVLSGIARLAYLSIAGITVGLVIAKIVEWIGTRLDDAGIEIATSIFVPYSGISRAS